GDGHGGFEVVRAGLPSDFSSQAIALIPQRGRPPQLVVSSDKPEMNNLQQVRMYVFEGRDKGWAFRPEAIAGGSFSYSLNTCDYDGDGWMDILTGSHWSGDTGLVWKSEGVAGSKLLIFTYFI